MSIFDRLQQQLDIQKREHGISALELTDLPPNLRRIMRLMLREVVLKYTELEKAIQAMPEAQRLAKTELDEALQSLVEHNWLIRMAEGEYTAYRVNLRRKAGSALNQDIWASLSSKIIEPDNQGNPDPQT
jgi:hypothetical protein